MTAKTMAEVLAEHRIRWVLTVDPDYNERMPHVGRHLPECLTCGPVGSDVEASDHQAAALSTAGFGLVAGAEAKALEDAAAIVASEEDEQWRMAAEYSPGAQIVAQRMNIVKRVIRARAAAVRGES